jgi:hypothetical protein
MHTPSCRVGDWSNLQEAGRHVNIREEQEPSTKLQGDGEKEGDRDEQNRRDESWERSGHVTFYPCRSSAKCIAGRKSPP